MSDPPLSDIDFKNKMAWVWTTLNLGILELGFMLLFHSALHFFLHVPSVQMMLQILLGQQLVQKRFQFEQLVFLLRYLKLVVQC